MVNYSKKIAQALTIIRKYYGAINVQRTDNEDVVYLFDYTSQKKTIGSESINKAVEKAVKQNDFPKDIYYYFTNINQFYRYRYISYIIFQLKYE